MITIHYPTQVPTIPRTLKVFENLIITQFQIEQPERFLKYAW